MRGVFMKKRIYLILGILLLLISSCTTQQNKCDSVNNLDKKDECFHQLAIKTEENLFAICGNINDVDKREVCYLELVSLKTEPYDCGVFVTQEGKDGCYMLQGANFNMESYCDKVQDTATKDICYNEIVSGLSTKTELCNKIDTANIKQKCLDNTK